MGILRILTSLSSDFLLNSNTSEIEQKIKN
jgi:hypothetical protein